MGRNKSKNIRW